MSNATAVISSGSVPVLVTVSICHSVQPGVTLIKFRLEGLTEIPGSAHADTEPKTIETMRTVKTNALLSLLLILLSSID
jgi:hypothetical protein